VLLKRSRLRSRTVSHERPEDRHLFGELIDQRRLRAVSELHFAAGFDLMRDLFEQVTVLLVSQIALPPHGVCTVGCAPSSVHIMRALAIFAVEKSGRQATLLSTFFSGSLGSQKNPRPDF
jgi:hypothetical protein